jgi:hypothetical protein
MTFKILLLLAFTLAPMTLLADADVAPPPPSSVMPPSAAAASGEKLEPTTRKAVIINEMNVWKLSGTIMVQHADKTDPTPLATGSVVEKGDIVTVYDGSWVILKTRKGDKIGLDGNTVMTLDECYFEGPDRQVRLLLDRGTLLLETHGDDSRQSFFEINTGKVVTSIDEVKAILSFDAKNDTVDIKYIEGKIHVIDQTHEETFHTQESEYNGYTRSETNTAEDTGMAQEHTEHTWNYGKMAQEEPIPMEEIDELNFRKFFDGEPRVAPDDNNMLLDDSKRVPFRQR